VVSATVSGLSLVTTSVSAAVMFSVIVDLLDQVTVSGGEKHHRVEGSASRPGARG
jgi:hypothetical protein